MEFLKAMDGIEGRPETRIKRALLRWHRRAGKDKACWCYLVKEACRQSGVYYYFFPTYAQGRKVIWEEVSDGFKLLDHIPKELIKRVNNQEMVIELTNRSIIRIIGTDNVDAVMGTNPVGCVFSEYAMQDPVAWELIRPILMVNKGWAVFNSTPRGRNHMYDLELNVKDDPQWYFSALQTIHEGYGDAVYSALVPMKDLEQQMKEGATWQYIEQEFGVSYTAGVQGAFYMDLINRTRDMGRVGEFPYDPHLYVDTFWDLGIDDSTAVWFRQIKGDRCTFIDYFESSGKDLSYYVDMLREKGYRFRTHYLPHDGKHKSLQTGMTTKDVFQSMLRNAGISDDVTVVPRHFVQDGINAVRTKFGRYWFNDSPGVRDGLKKLELYHRKYDEKKKTFMKEPVHDWTSHCADALRIEAMSDDIEYERASYMANENFSREGLTAEIHYDILDDTRHT